MPETLYVFLPPEHHVSHPKELPSRPIAQTAIGGALAVPAIVFCVVGINCFSDADKARNSDDLFSGLSAGIDDANGTTCEVAAGAFAIASTVLCVIATVKWNKYHAAVPRVGVEYDPKIKRLGLCAQVGF